MRLITLLVLIIPIFIFAQNKKYIKNESTEEEIINDTTRKLYISSGHRFYLKDTNVITSWDTISNVWVDSGSYYVMSRNAHKLYVKKNTLYDSTFIFEYHGSKIVLEPSLILYNNDIQSGYVKSEWQMPIRSSYARLLDSSTIRFDSCFGPGIHVEVICNSHGFIINKVFDRGIIHKPIAAKFLDIVFKVISSNNDFIKNNGKKWDKISTDTGLTNIYFSKINKYKFNVPSSRKKFKDFDFNDNINILNLETSYILSSNANTKLLIKRIRNIVDDSAFVTDASVSLTASNGGEASNNFSTGSESGTNAAIDGNGTSWYTDNTNYTAYNISMYMNNNGSNNNIRRGFIKFNNPNLSGSTLTAAVCSLYVNYGNDGYDSTCIVKATGTTWDKDMYQTRDILGFWGSLWIVGQNKWYEWTLANLSTMSLTSDIIICVLRGSDKNKTYRNAGDGIYYSNFNSSSTKPILVLTYTASEGGGGSTPTINKKTQHIINMKTP